MTNFFFSGGGGGIVAVVVVVVVTRILFKHFDLQFSLVSIIMIIIK